jgi:hypothetical protein
LLREIAHLPACVTVLRQARPRRGSHGAIAADRFTNTLAMVSLAAEASAHRVIWRIPDNAVLFTKSGD